MASKIKVGDTVRVIAGADKNNEGKVLSVDHKNHRVVVEGVHMVKKHEKPSMSNQEGGIVETEAPIDISNVMLLLGDKATRVGFKTVDGKKVRFAKVSGETIDK
jgi:large subunit ribosomal protein L24